MPPNNVTWAFDDDAMDTDEQNLSATESETGQASDTQQIQQAQTVATTVNHQINHHSTAQGLASQPEDDREILISFFLRSEIKAVSRNIGRIKSDATQELASAEFNRIEAVYRATIIELRRKPEYLQASEDEKSWMFQDWEEEYEMLLNNLFWLLRKEYCVTTNLKLLARTDTGLDGPGTDRYRRRQEPIGTVFIPAYKFQGYYPLLLQEMHRRHVALRNKPPTSNITDGYNPRHDLVFKKFNYTLTKLRKKLGLCGTSSQRSLQDRIWKNFRRDVRLVIAEHSFRSIKKSEEPGRLHSETLFLGRKIIFDHQELWEATGSSLKTIEEMAYWLVTYEASLTGRAAGFSSEDDEGEARTSTPRPVRRTTRPGLPSNRRGRDEFDDEDTPGPSKKRKNSTTTADKEAPPKQYLPGMGVLGVGKVTSPGKKVGVALTKWREAFELKGLQLEAERKLLEANEMQAKVTEKALQYQEKFGEAHDSKGFP
ncbi:hypothetical protein FN846DRAFT_969988 [Sphaerosporella brunnea]|uniref:Uncharacterized protein n=1 Tax=Sphaerosporella brunnea TaxID=1250544 RepID=A0A5J5EKX1_9PEZI|nr:hypothetical protein FN846DRAFT_969988 [Sphaerosporella brunnea]